MHGHGVVCGNKKILLLFKWLAHVTAERSIFHKLPLVLHYQLQLYL